MNTKVAEYSLLGGKKIKVEYDADAPCWCCEKPVGSASMGGTVLCPACDCGHSRETGQCWTSDEHQRYSRNWKKNRDLAYEKIAEEFMKDMTVFQ